jgi:hypothetical protein
MLVEMLQLAATASAEVAAGRDGMVRPRQHRAVGSDRVSRSGKRHVPPRRGNAVALGGDADDLFRLAHSAAA